MLFPCVGTLYRYEICFDDSVRLTLQYKTGKVHMDSLMCSTKLNKMCSNLWLTTTLMERECNTLNLLLHIHDKKLDYTIYIYIYIYIYIHVYVDVCKYIHTYIIVCI